VNHWMAAKLAARFGADIGLPDLLVAPAQCDRQRDFTRPCRRFVSRHWSGNSRQWAQVEEPGVSPKDESPKGAKAQKIGLEKQAWPVGPAAYRLRVAADRVGVFSASRPRRRARGLPQAPLCRPFPYLPPGKGTGGHPASIAKPRAGCRPECPDGLSRARLYPSHAWSRSEGLRGGLKRDGFRLVLRRRPRWRVGGGRDGAWEEAAMARGCA
jgi:hypothetical protein